MSSHCSESHVEDIIHFTGGIQFYLASGSVYFVNIREWTETKQITGAITGQCTATEPDLARDISAASKGH